MSSRRGGREESPEVKLSKSLSWMLRHGAVQAHVPIGADGFALVDDVLTHNRFRGVTVDDVRRIVENNNKQRFALETRNGKLYIRANQGHSIDVPELALTPIANAASYPVVVHGTYRKFWPQIKATGLSKMSRNHVHCAKGLSGGNVISGMRGTCDTFIFINLERALSEGLQFFESANGVILCDHIPPHLFKYVLDVHLSPFDLGFPATPSDAEMAVMRH
ncbi:tRNA 2'-phosphotransferase 1 [Pelomyxa schiedti]|nr:tRNA 2'-phosphotransferase 1 [Pelomyxa schiedti]